MANDTPNAEHFYELFWETMQRGEDKYERITTPRH
jgi:hypothetical protein